MMMIMNHADKLSTLGRTTFIGDLIIALFHLRYYRLLSFLSFHTRDEQHYRAVFIALSEL